MKRVATMIAAQRAGMACWISLPPAEMAIGGWNRPACSLLV